MNSYSNVFNCSHFSLRGCISNNHVPNRGAEVQSDRDLLAQQWWVPSVGWKREIVCKLPEPGCASRDCVCGNLLLHPWRRHRMVHCAFVMLVKNES